MTLWCSLSVRNWACSACTGLLTIALVLLSAGGLAAQVTSYAFVSNSGDQTISFIDLATGGRLHPDAHVFGSDLTICSTANPDGRHAYAMSGQTLTIFDTVTGTVTATIDTGANPFQTCVGVTPDGQRAYVTSSTFDHRVYVVDLVGGSLIGPPIDVRFGPKGLAFSRDGQRVYVASETGSLNVISTATNTVIDQIPVPVSATGVTLSPDGRTAYVGYGNDGSLGIVDLTTKALVATVAEPSATGIHTSDGLAATPDGSQVWLCDSEAQWVTVIDTASQTVIGTIPIPGRPQGVSFSPDGLTAYVTDAAVGQLWRIDVATRIRSADVIATGAAPRSVSPFIGPNLIVPAVTPFSVGSDADLTAAGFGPNFIVFHGGELDLTGDVISSRAVSLLVDGGTIDTNGHDLTMSGVLGEGRLTKSGGGTLTLPAMATASHTGGTFVSGGAFQIDGVHLPDLHLNAATLRGNGRAGDVTLSSGGIQAGNATTTGLLQVANITFTSNVTFTARLNGPTPGTDYDAVTVSGNALINGATLALSLQAGYSPAPFTSFVLLTNATGTFAGLLDGAPVVVGGERFRITYHNGSSGADVWLTVDKPPAVTSINDVTLAANGSAQTTFTVGDDLTLPAAMTLTASSANQTLLPNANVTIATAGPLATLTITPAAHVAGQTMVTVTASDGLQITSRTFLVTVTDAAPTLSPFAPRTLPPGRAVGPIAFTVDDDVTPVGALIVSATSSNSAVVRDTDLVLGGVGANRTLNATPVPGVGGSTQITVSVSDGTHTTSNSFTLTIGDYPTYYLAEGSSNGFFDTDILIANPNASAAPVRLTFLKEDGATVVQEMTLTATSRTTVRAAHIVELTGSAFSTVVTSVSGLPLVVERTMWWDASRYGAHGEKANSGPAVRWYFAEGSQGYFHTYFLLLNPNVLATTAHVTYLLDGGAPLLRDYSLPPTSRVTIDASTEPDLANRSFGALVTFDLPGMAERAMYFGDAPLFSGGHDAAGVEAPSTSWLIAEGATGNFFDTFVLIANPGDADATVTTTYLPTSGTPLAKVHAVPAHQRLTINIATEDPTLANAAVSTQITSDQPIIVERSMYWPHGNWYEAHNSAGETSAATKWGLAEGRVGGANHAQTYILLANPGTTAASVSATFLRTDGTHLSKTFTVAATSRLNIAVTGPDSDVPELGDESFGTVIESDQPILVERSLYTDANGVTWAAGTNVTGTRLP